MSFCVKVFVCLLLISFACHNNVPKSQNIINIRLEIKSGEIFFIYKNNSARVIRIWQPENSWGWENLSFILHAKNSGVQIKIFRGSTMGWTKNGPAYFEIAPGHEMRIPLHLNEKSWKTDRDISKIKNEPLSVKAIFRITNTKEAKELNVWIGKTESEWLTAPLPHNWLFPVD
jgi:hypothetical protein